MAEITLVPHSEINKLWPVVKPMLERAVADSRGRVDAIDVYTDLIQNKQTLWIAFDDEKEILGCCTVRIIDYATFRACNLENIAGDEMDKWIWDGFKVLSRYARDMKCQRLEGQGRPGWERFLKKAGWDKFSTRVEYIIPEDEGDS